MVRDLLLQYTVDDKTLTDRIGLIGVTLNNASDYRTNGHYRTPNPNPNPNPSPLVR